jgi:hypothetical protein
MKTYLRGKDVDERYRICARTRKNWVAQGLLPKPVIRNGAEFYAEDELDECDRRDKVDPVTPWKSRGTKLRRGKAVAAAARP